MKTSSRSLPWIAAIAALIISPLAAHAQNAGAAIPGQYIVQLRAGSAADPGDVANRNGVAASHVYRTAAHGFAASIPPGLVARVAADPDVAAIIPDRVIDISAPPGGGGGGTVGQTTPDGVVRIGAVGLSNKGAGVGVAIVDTGIDFNHADLGVEPQQFSAFGGSAQDNNGHGTHVAGTVAARDNGIDVVGVAPLAKLFAVKVLNQSGSGSDSQVTAGLDWVAANAASLGIKVVNMSLGRPGSVDDNPVMRASIQTLVNNGVTVVVAAGNDAGMTINQSVPAGYPEVIAVGSTTATDGTTQMKSEIIPADTASYFTTDGAGVFVSAPGESREDILKGYRISSVGILSTKLGGGTTTMSGTSMASPHVAGVIALEYAKYPGLTVGLAKARLYAGTVRDGTAPLDSPTSTYSFDGYREGVLNAPGALIDP